MIAMFLGVSSLFAQGNWSLQQCMEYAVEHGPRKTKQKSQNSIYHQDYLEAIGRLLPSLNAQTNIEFKIGRGLDSQTNTYTNKNSFDNNYSIGSELLLFDGLANVSRVRMQRINKLMGKEQLRDTEDMIAYETMEAFYNVLYYKQTVDLAEQQLAESSENLRQVSRMEELGVKGYPDVAEMKAKQAEDTYNLTKQQNMLVIGIIILKEKMNFPIDEDLQIDNNINKEIVTKSEETALLIYNQALNYTPKALVAQSTLKSKQIAYKVSKGNLSPTISANFGFSTNFSRFMNGSKYSPFKDQLKDKRGHYFGFTLSVPLFNGFSQTASVKRSRAELVMARNEYDETLRKLYSEIEQAVADMNGQADQYVQAAKQVEAMKVAHDVNKRKYNEGLVSALELHTSANRLLKAKTDETNALLQYELKCKLVNYYKGEPFIVKNRPEK